uniref:ATP synthase F0 subunit 8 n=1 Tax=Galdieria sulphuraria TaxID=130081 RepID=A0A075W1S1_GALSU|nr:ATP synthase F0 subunit 8 [Galdieria sulphuraria]AIG92647.1 ATP synthase F0 subunit 8 [Galdieria sulphuraria]
MPQMDVVIVINEIIWLGIGMGIVNRGVEEGMKEKYRSMRREEEEEEGGVRKERRSREGRREEEEVEMRKRRREIW